MAEIDHAAISSMTDGGSAADIIEFELVVRAARRKRLSEIEAPNTAESS